MSNIYYYLGLLIIYNIMSVDNSRSSAFQFFPNICSSVKKFKCSDSKFIHKIKPLSDIFELLEKVQNIKEMEERLEKLENTVNQKELIVTPEPDNLVE